MQKKLPFLKKYDYKHFIQYICYTFPKLNIVVSLIILLYILAITIFGIQEYKDFVFNGEYILSLTGIIILSCCCLNESKKETLELLLTKKIKISILLLLKYTLANVILFIIICLYAIIVRVTTIEFDLLFNIFSLYVTAFSLGNVALIVYLFSNNISLSYMISFSYYFFEFMSNGKYTKSLYLFGLLETPSLSGKTILFFVFLFLGLIFIRNFKQELSCK